jgi:hypothetical protein
LTAPFSKALKFSKINKIIEEGGGWEREKKWIIKKNINK